MQEGIRRNFSKARSFSLLVLISGNGSNLQALIDASNTPALPDTKITHVISNRKSAYGLERAEKASIPTSYHNLLKYKKERPDTPEGIQAAREAYDADLASMILEKEPDLVVCAGFLHILSAPFIDQLAKERLQCINLHPAKPGAFNGIGAIQRAFEAYQKGEITSTGAMIHYVISEVDMGTPILVRDIEIKKEDTVEDLESRIHDVEHELIVEGTQIAIENVKKTKQQQA